MSFSLDIGFEQSDFIFQTRINNRSIVLKGLFLGSRCGNSLAMPVYKPESEGHLNGLAKQFEKNENCTALAAKCLEDRKGLLLAFCETNRSHEFAQCFPQRGSHEGYHFDLVSPE